MDNNFTAITQLRFWCQKVLPLVYDDSLSYYEVLCKVQTKINDLIENNNTLPDYILNLIRDYISGGEIGKVLSETLANYMLNVKYPPEGLKAAKGDGTADDTEAIQGCIDYAFNHGGMSVYFPSGAYLTESLTLRNKATLFGQDRYTTRLVLKGGATNPLFSGVVDELTLTGLGFNGNMGIQVNSINLFTITVNSALISNCFLTDGFHLLNAKVNKELQINNVIFNNGLENSAVFSGSGYVMGSNLIFNSISGVTGKNFITLANNSSILEQVKLYGTSPNGILITGNNNVIKMWNEQSVKPFTDQGVNNSIEVYGKSDLVNVEGNSDKNIGGNVTENINGNVIENIGGDVTKNIDGKMDLKANNIKLVTHSLTDPLNTLTLTAAQIDETATNKTIAAGNLTENVTENKNLKVKNLNETVTETKTINLKDLVINSANPVTYKEPSPFSDFFKTIPLKDSTGNSYDVLVSTDKTINVGSQNIDYVSLLPYLKTMSFDEAMTKALTVVSPHGTIYIPQGTFTSSGITINKPCNIIGNYTGWTYAEKTDFVTQEQYRETLINFTGTQGFLVQSIGVNIHHVTIKGTASTFIGVKLTLSNVNSLTNVLRFIRIEDCSIYCTGVDSIGISSADIILSTFRNIHIYGCKNGVVLASSSANQTSIVFDTVWVQGYLEYAFKISRAYYCNFISCAADSITGGLTGYYLEDCRSVSFHACGCEIAQNCGWLILNSNQIYINGFSYKCNENGIGGTIKLVNSKNVNVNCFTLTDPSPTKLGLEVDTSSTWTVNNSNFFTLYKGGQTLTINGSHTENYITEQPVLSPTVGSQSFSYAQYNYGKIYLTAIITIPETTEKTLTITLPKTAIYNDKGLLIGPSNGFINTTAGTASVATLDNQPFKPGVYVLQLNYTPEPL